MGLTSPYYLSLYREEFNVQQNIWIQSIWIFLNIFSKITNETWVSSSFLLKFLLPPHVAFLFNYWVIDLLKNMLRAFTVCFFRVWVTMPGKQCVPLWISRVAQLQTGSPFVAFLSSSEKATVFYTVKVTPSICWHFVDMLNRQTYTSEHLGYLSIFFLGEVFPKQRWGMNDRGDWGDWGEIKFLLWVEDFGLRDCHLSIFMGSKMAWDFIFLKSAILILVLPPNSASFSMAWNFCFVNQLTKLMSYSESEF